MLRPSSNAFDQDRISVSRIEIIIELLNVAANHGKPSGAQTQKAFAVRYAEIDTGAFLDQDSAMLTQMQLPPHP